VIDQKDLTYLTRAVELAELGVPEPPVRPLPINEIAPGLQVEGPVEELAERVRRLHRGKHE
jgi:hypothetical protein